MPASSSILATAWLLISRTVSSAAIPQTAAQNATEFALVYGYPLLAWQTAVGPLYDNLGHNVFYHGVGLTDADGPTAHATVAPNQDTIYSSMAIDLTRFSVNITLPFINPEWFHLFSFYTPFGDNWANFGSANKFNASGSYLVQRSPDPDSYGIVEDPTGQYVGIVNSPQALSLLLVRWLVYNESSIDVIHFWQTNTLVRQILLPCSEHYVGGTGAALGAGASASTPADKVMSMLAEINPFSPALEPSDRDHVEQQLSLAGISSQGTYNALSKSAVDLDAANATIYGIAIDALEDPSLHLDVGNGWTVAKNSGFYGKDYAARLEQATFGYLGLEGPNAYYPTHGDGIFNLSADQSLLYTFSGRPPLMQTGFWSVTLYQNDYLVPNPLDRGSLGDRANLTFPNGDLIYHYGGETTLAPDGEFQILIQPADVAPPQNWTSNWLPGPAGGGQNISAILRFYDAEEAVINGSYVYPVVTSQPVIKA